MGPWLWGSHMNTPAFGMDRLEVLVSNGFMIEDDASADCAKGQAVMKTMGIGLRAVFGALIPAAMLVGVLFSGGCPTFDNPDVLT